MIERQPTWEIFPVQENGKQPYPFLANKLNQRGFNVATTNQLQIDYWEKTYPNANWALRTGKNSGCWVLDIDVKNNARGAESFSDLVGDKKDFPDTLAVETPSGGIHFYFEMEPEINRNLIGVGKFGGIDVKTDGGYVLIPPSKIEGKGYRYLNHNPICKAPQWLKDYLFKQKERLNKNDTEVPEMIEQNDNRAESLSKYLLNKYIPKAVKGMRNHTLMEMLCQMRDNIIPKDMATERALEFVNKMNDADFTAKEALATVKSVYNRNPRKPSFTLPDIDFKLIPMEGLKFFDQSGIADYILSRHSNIVYIPEKSWAVYIDEGYWKTSNADTEVLDIVVDELRALQGDERYKGYSKLFVINKKNVDDIMSFMKRKSVKSYSQFNAHPELLNTKSGVINLKTLELTKHSPLYYFDYKLDVNYDPNADQSKWNKFLRESLENADRLEKGTDGLEIYQLELLQISAGYSITGETCEECLFYVYGKTRSGKSTFINTINDIMGPLGSTIQMTALLQKKYVSDTQNFELASLIGKRFVVSSETDRDTYLDSSKIKNITGRDTIKCAYKYKDPFQAKVSFKLWLTSNNEISIDPTDDAAWGRFRVFSFPYSKLNSADINLKDELMRNKDAIFTWLCQGAFVWYWLKDEGKRLPMTESMKGYLRIRQDELDTVSDFLSSFGVVPTDCKKDETDVSFFPNRDLYSEFVSWCERSGIRAPHSKNSFISILSSKGFVKDLQRVNGKPTKGFWARKLF